VSHVASLEPPFQVFFSNNALPRRLFQEAGYEVRGAPFYERARFSGTRIRALMQEGKGWQECVPPEVVQVVEEVRGVERMHDLAQQDDEA
jgi:nicotinamide-nucleotide adenylyltransferase